MVGMVMRHLGALAPAVLLLFSSGLAGCDSRRVEAAPPLTPPTAAVADKVDNQDASAPKPTESGPYITSGPLVAEQQADVAAERYGRVDKVLVDIGDHVHAGQVLATLDDRSLRAALESQTAKVASLRAQVREWEAEQKMDEADLRRADQLLEAHVLAKDGWEHTKYKLDEVLAEVARYQADTVAAEAELTAAKVALEQSQLRAPFAGVVGRRSVRPTQEIKKGDLAFWITAQAPLRILFTVPESAMSMYPAGAALDLTTPVYPELHQAARVFRVSPVVDPASDSVQVIGAVAHPSPLLKPGMSMMVSARDAATVSTRHEPPHGARAKR